MSRPNVRAAPGQWRGTPRTKSGFLDTAKRVRSNRPARLLREAGVAHRGVPIQSSLLTLLDHPSPPGALAMAKKKSSSRKASRGTKSRRTARPASRRARTAATRAKKKVSARKAVAKKSVARKAAAKKSAARKAVPARAAAAAKSSVARVARVATTLVEQAKTGVEHLGDAAVGLVDRVTGTTHTGTTPPSGPPASGNAPPRPVS